MLFLIFDHVCHHLIVIQYRQSTSSIDTPPTDVHNRHSKSHRQRCYHLNSYYREELERHLLVEVTVEAEYLVL